MDPKFLNYIKYEDLMNYTNNLSDENCIGHFQFGKIYNGQIDHGIGYIQPVTVKIWDASSSVRRDNHLRFMREVIFLRDEEVKCQPAAPKLLGYVCDGEHLGVVYGLKAINTVCTQLTKDEFNWLQRIKVGLWFARLVKFFHSPDLPYGPFLIRNIDATHILLNEDYIPKLFDFSLMTGGGIFPEEPQHETLRPCNNMGMDFPEEPQHETLRPCNNMGMHFPEEPKHEAKRPRKNTGEQDDVFGFGRLLLCLISKQVISKEEDVESIITHWNSLSESLVHGRSFEADPYFYDCDGSQISGLVMECLHSIPDKRPSMEQVVERLEKLQVVQKHADLLEVKPKPRNKY